MDKHINVKVVAHLFICFAITEYDTWTLVKNFVY